MEKNQPQEPSFGLDVDFLMQALAEGNVSQRMRLARQIAGFLGDAAEPPGERQQVLPVALRLAADEAPEVRRTLAAGLVGLADLNADLLFAIVSDDDDLAVPFLGATPALTQVHMLSVLRVGDAARQVVVLLRPDITPDVIDFTVKSLPFEANALLLENASTPLTPAQFQTLYDRFADIEAAVERLLARTDLPASIRILQARRAATRLQKLLAERDWLPANDAADLIADAEENAVLAVLTSASVQQLPSLVSFLINQDILTPSIIVRAACRGDVDVLANCLSILAGVPLERVRQQMAGAGSLRPLLERTGLPGTCHWTLQAVCDVARDERQERIRLSSDDFGARVVEALMTRYENMPAAEQPRSLDVIGRYAAGRARLVARRLRADITAAAA